MDYKKAVALGLGALGGTKAAVAGGLAARFSLGRRRAEEVWESTSFPRIEDMGEVEHLSILPLVDWYTMSDGLVGEPGVSYLVKADDRRILFDVGKNERAEHPSPLLNNMRVLGVDMADIDALVISHFHVDHVGGWQNVRNKTFGISREPVSFNGVPAYLPEKLSNPTAECFVTEQPEVIAPGIATTGTIPRQLFFMGWIPEQSLAIRVKGKGIVLVIGCGHPTVGRILSRAEELFDEPIYGVIGGLHLPATASRINWWRFPVMRVFGTGKWPWDLLNKGDAEDAISEVKKRKPGIVSLSPHDSCDWSIEEFRRNFREEYRYLLAGLEIEIS